VQCAALENRSRWPGREEASAFSLSQHQVSVRHEALHIRASLYVAPVIVVKPKRSFKMRLKTIAKLIVVSMVILTGSPVLAAQIVRADAHCRSCEQKAGACRGHLGACVTRASDAPRWNSAHATHDWPAGMILE
jgi:hypothetical protein